MDLQRKISAVVELAQRLNIHVREAHLGGDGGGLCHVRGQRILFLDRDADLSTRYARSLRDLAQIAELDNVHMLPELRDDLNAQR